MSNGGHRIATGKLAARVAIFGIHIASFGAAYQFAPSSTGLSIAMCVLSLICLLAELVLAAHFTVLAGSEISTLIRGGLRLRHVFSVWYLFAIGFWGYNAYMISR